MWRRRQSPRRARALKRVGMRMCAFYLHLDHRKWSQFWLRLWTFLGAKKFWELTSVAQTLGPLPSAKKQRLGMPRYVMTHVMWVNKTTARPAGTSAAQGSAHLSSLLWSHLWLPRADFVDTNVIIIVEMYILRAKQRLNGQSYHLMIILFLCYTARIWGFVKVSK